MPMAQHLGESFPSATPASLFVREIKKRRGRLNPCRHVQHLHTIFPLESIKGSLTVIMLEMLPVPLPFNLSSVYDTVPGM